MSNIDETFGAATQPVKAVIDADRRSPSSEYYCIEYNKLISGFRSLKGHSHIREARRCRAADASAKECNRVEIGQARRGGAAPHRLPCCAIRS